MPGLLAHWRMRRAVETYLAGELSPESASGVARHLSVCWECSVAAETLRLIKRALRQHRDRIPTFGERRLRCFAEELATAPTSRRDP